MKTNGLDNRMGYNFASGIDYSINEKNSISLEGRVFITDRSDLKQNNTGIFEVPNMMPTEFLIARTIDETPSQNYVMSLNYKLIPGSATQLSADVSFGRYNNSNGTEQPNNYFDKDNNMIRSVNNRYNTNTFIDLFSAMLDYEKKFSFLTFSTGVKLSYISTDNSLAFYNILNENPVLDVTRSNDFNYQENVAAFYFMMNAAPNQYIALNAGVRMENTSSLGVLDSEMPSLDDRVSRNYNDFFPNIGISYNDQKNNEISASIGRRVTRPNYQHLNPFEAKLSELQSWKGNPFLDPNYITNYQVSWSFKGKLVISNSNSITRDFFANIFVIEGEKGSILTPRNMDKVTNNGLSITYPVQALPWWQLNSFFNYSYQTYKGDMQGTTIYLVSNNYNLRVQNHLKLPGGIGLELTYYIYSPWVWRGSVEVEGNHGMEVGLRKDFLNRMLILQISGNDVFRTNSDYFYKGNYGGIVTNGIRTFDNQRFGFSLTWNFGNQQARARERKRSAIDDELRRLGD